MRHSLSFAARIERLLADVTGVIKAGAGPRAAAAAL
jgi:hypothetical protein